ncbi:MAG: PaaI family thioesterase [Phenylobacterium sp.]
MDDEAAVPPPPQGFAPSAGRGPFTSLNGPIYHRLDGEVLQHAFFPLERHTNGLGLVHGGMLSTFMDGVLAAAVGRSLRRRAVTIHLSIDFLNMGRAGEWILGEGRVTRATQAVAFAEGRAFVGPRDLIRVSGVFKLMRAR